MKKVIITLVISFLILKSVDATHFAGGEITYTHVGGNDYLITFTFYRDCSGISEPSSCLIHFESSSNPIHNFNAYLPKKASPNGIEITHSCNSSPSVCAGGTGYGVNEWIYQAQVTLPPSSCWRIWYQMCCRNASSTIQNSNTKSAYIEATMNNLLAPYNNSPVLTNKPINIIYTNQSFTYNQGAFDLDEDSLSYEFIKPKVSATENVIYIPPYSYTQPILSNPPITLDPVSGNISMTPTMNIISPLAVLIKEWRVINGVPTVIGTITRDMQVNVLSSNNSTPVLSGIDLLQTHVYDPNDTIFYIEACAETTLTFDINTYDPDTFNPNNVGQPEKINLILNKGIPGSFFNIYNNNGNNSPFANFYWEIKNSDISNIPYCFTVTVIDEACPYGAYQTYSYCILVKGIDIDIGNDTLLCQGDTLMLFPQFSESNINNYVWTINNVYTGVPTSSSIFQIDASTFSPGFYSIGVTATDTNETNACPGIDNIFVTVVYQPDVDLGNDTIIYSGNNIMLDAGKGYLYNWNIGALTQTINVKPPGGIYYVTVDGGYGTRCTDSDTIRVDFLSSNSQNDFLNDVQINLFPNPTIDELNISIDGLYNEANLLIFNNQGQIIFEENINKNSQGKHLIELSSLDLSKGFYSLKIIGNTINWSKKFVVY